MKIVVCGSYGDLDGFLRVLHDFQEKFGMSNVFPDNEHLKKSMPCIFAHHVAGKETGQTISTRSNLMQSYFNKIDTADLVVILNEKKGREHYGAGTTIELGYAFAKGKRIHFTRQPTDSNILSLLQASNKMNEELYV